MGMPPDHGGSRAHVRRRNNNVTTSPSGPPSPSVEFSPAPVRATEIARSRGFATSRLLAPALGAAVGLAILGLGSFDVRWILGFVILATAGLLGMTFLRSLTNVWMVLVFTIQAE